MNGIESEITRQLVVMNALKLASLAVALASTAWALLRKTTFEDETGQKKLTSSGYVAIALAVGSFIIACSMQGFETMTKISEKRARQVQAANEAAREAVKEARSARIEAAARENAAIARLARAEDLAGRAEERSARAEERLRSLSIAEAERRRDLALAKDVNEGSRRNLVRTGAALVQLDRILHPIEGFRIIVRWELPLGPEMADLKAAAGRIDLGDPPSWPSWLHVASRSDESSTLQIDSNSPFYPTPARYPEVAAAIFGSTTRVAFFSPEFPRNAIHPVNMPEADLYAQAATAESIKLEYDVNRHSLMFESSTGPDPSLRRTPRIMSSLDLERSKMGIFITGTGRVLGLDRDRLKLMRARMKPVSIDLHYSNRNRYFSGDQIAATPGLFGVPLFMSGLSES